MTWVKVSDTFDTDRHVERVSLEASGVLIRALTYSARYLLDGEVDDTWFRTRIPNKKRRDRILEELTREGHLQRLQDAYLLANWSDFHFSKAEEEQRKRTEREKKARQRAAKRGHVPEGRQGGHPGESPGSAVGSGRDRGQDGWELHEDESRDPA